MQRFAHSSDTQIAEGSRLVRALNRWAISAPIVVDFPGTARPHPDQVDYKFVNGWVATGDLPCREALRAALPHRSIALDDCPALPNIHTGADGPKVDFSTFCFTPQLISRWAQARFVAPHAQVVTCRIETCGGVHLWAGHQKIAAFEPYDRNVTHSARVDLPFSAGETTLTVYFDDLHERDTICHFQISLLDPADITQTHPAAGATDGNDMVALLEGLRTQHIFHTSGTIDVLTDYPVSQPVTLSLAPGPTGAETMNVFADTAGQPACVVLSAPGQAKPLLDVSDAVTGGVLLPLEARIEDRLYRRSLGTTVLPDPTWIDATDLSARKAHALDLICAAGKPGPSRALALLQRGDVEEAEDLLQGSIAAVTEHHDCADFFLLPLLRIWRDHGASLGNTTRAKLRAAILEFRYWLDEPGNDVMWFWSENHALCFHACQHLAGHLFADDVFPLSGRFGRDQEALGRERLGKWFASIQMHGLAEWNSAAYYPIDLVGLLTLLDMSPDADIRRDAGALCDQIFRMVALHTCGGVPAGSQGRCYEKEIFAGPATELGAAAAIAFGGPWHSGHERAAALLAISGYVPPPGSEDLLSPPAGRALFARYAQGLNANARLSVWKTAQVQLSSVADHKTGAIGHQQHVVDLHMSNNPLARIWVNHPGDLKVWGGGRPSLWAGSGILPKVAQRGDQVIVLFDLTRHDPPIDLTHAFIPADVMDEIVPVENWVFARSGSGFAALWSSQTPVCVSSGLYAGSEWRVSGRRAAWVLIAGDQAGHGDFAAFRASCQARSPTHDPSAMSAQCGAQRVAFDDAPDPDFPLQLNPQIEWNDHDGQII